MKVFNGRQLIERLSCYTIAMNIYVSHAGGDFDYEHELYEPLKTSELARANRFFLPHEPKNVAIHAADELQHTDLLVAEVSFPSTGQGIEIGQAKAMGVPVVCFYRSGAKISSSLRFVTDNIVEYADASNLLDKLQRTITQRAADSSL